jgi:hypothetical protein
MAAGSRLADVPSNETRVEGFRLVMIPEPATGLLVAAGLIGLASRGARVRLTAREG